MKKIIPLAILLLTGCASTESINESSETLGNHAFKTNAASQFCDGGKIVYYFEATQFYAFKCEDGRYFNLKK